MISLIRTLTKGVATLYAFGAALCMGLVFLIIFVNSVQRYTFGGSFEWGEELPVYLAVYGVMFGMAWAYMLDRHVAFDLLANLLPKRVHEAFNAVVDLLMVAVGVLLGYSGYLFMMKRGKVDASSLISSARALRDATGIDSLAVLGQMYPYYFAMVLGGGMLALAALLRFANRILRQDKHIAEGAF
ncbi:MAG: TRAP transporter small permease subunit [Oceanospirillales bacterium]|nr:TRAP transporter small permease subunit [Oceanospirillales bacterium]MBR9889867.1 TRAP transporter small permease subunit [Oceanospirillales bacterium]